jgi:hypothetical protein
MKSLENALMASGVRQKEHLLTQITMVQHEDTGTMEQQTVRETPLGIQLARL